MRQTLLSKKRSQRSYAPWILVTVLTILAIGALLWKQTETASAEISHEELVGEQVEEDPDVSVLDAFKQLNQRWDEEEEVGEVAVGGGGQQSCRRVGMKCDQENSNLVNVANAGEAANEQQHFKCLCNHRKCQRQLVSFLKKDTGAWPEDMAVTWADVGLFIGQKQDKKECLEKWSLFELQEGKRVREYIKVYNTALCKVLPEPKPTECSALLATLGPAAAEVDSAVGQNTNNYEERVGDWAEGALGGLPYNRDDLKTAIREVIMNKKVMAFTGTRLNPTFDRMESMFFDSTGPQRNLACRWTPEAPAGGGPTPERPTNVAYWIAGPAGSGKSSIAKSIGYFHSYLRSPDRSALIGEPEAAADLSSIGLIDGDDYRKCTNNYQDIVKSAKKTACGYNFQSWVSGKSSFKKEDGVALAKKRSVIFPTTWDSVEISIRSTLISQPGVTNMVVEMDTDPWDTRYAEYKRAKRKNNQEKLKEFPQPIEANAHNTIVARGKFRFGQYGKPMETSGWGYWLKKNLIKNFFGRISWRSCGRAIDCDCNKLKIEFT